MNDLFALMLETDGYVRIEDVISEPQPKIKTRASPKMIEQQLRGIGNEYPIRRHEKPVNHWNSDWNRK